MKIVFSSEWYSENMGYMENVIPMKMAKRGHEIFLVTSTMQFYGDHSFYKDVYQNFLGPPIVDPGTKLIDGVWVTRLPIVIWWKRFKVARAKTRYIIKLNPDIVYAWDPRAFQTLLLSIASWFYPFKLFTGNHTVASVYPAYYSYSSWSILNKIYLRLTDTLIGWLAGLGTHISYAATPDAQEISNKFFGLPASKIRLLPLGLELSLFHPETSLDEKNLGMGIRKKFGILDHEILCIYTGRLTQRKNPLCLASAIKILRDKDIPFKGIFIGDGEQSNAIKDTVGCLVIPFLPYKSLPEVYWASDIGVWPQEESISMTDAAACGLPIIVSNRMLAKERIDGNGLTYEENNPEDLAKVLLSLNSAEKRLEMGLVGANRMADKFSAEKMAEILLSDFNLFVNN